MTSFQAGLSTSLSGGGMIRMSPPLLRSFTSDDGSFVLEHVPTGAVNLVATAPGFMQSTTNLDVQAGKELEGIEVELDRGVRLAGKVTSANGTPVSDARVRFVSTGPVPPMPGQEGATTDANGDYSFDALEPGERTVEASHRTLGTTRRSVTLKDAETRLDLQLDAGMPVTGMVVDEGGSPVGDAQVSAFGAGSSRGGSARSSADGSFEMDGLAAGRYRFTATKSGYAQARQEDVDISSGAPVRLTMGSGGTIYGRVTGVEQRDLAQTSVRATASGTYLSAAVDPSGNYRIEGVPAGTFQVSASVNTAAFGGGRSTPAQTVTVEAARSQQVDLEFRDDIVVDGRVTRNGTPLAGAIVSFVPKTAAAQTAARGTTDADGIYEITGLMEGEYDVAAIDTDRFSPYYTTATVRGSTTFDIDFTTVSLRGRVIDASTSEPLGSASVDLRPASQLESPRMGRGAATDNSGAFAIDFVPPGSYLLTVTRDGYGNLVREMTVGQGATDKLELKLSRGDGVTFRIGDARDGRTLRGYATVTDAMGRVVFDSRSSFGAGTDELRVPLSPGSYSASVGAMGYAPRTVTFTSPSVQNVGLTPGGTLLIESKHQERRRVQLVDANGQPYLHPFSRSGRIDLFPRPGTTTVQNVAAGQYTIQLLSDDENTVVDSVQVVVPEGGTGTAQL